jgi:hypothetical protein
MNRFVRKLPKTSKNKFLFLFLIGVLFTQFFTFKIVDLSNNIDGSWQYSIARIRSTDQDLGNNIHYTYGPLYEKMPSIPLRSDTTSDFLFGSFLFLVILCSFIYIFKFASDNLIDNGTIRHSSTLKYLLISFLILTTSYIDTLFYIYLFLTLYVLRHNINQHANSFILISLSIFSLLKVSFSISTLLLVPVFGLALAKFSYRKPLDTLIKILSFFVIYFLTFASLTSSGITKFIEYIQIGFLNSLAYAEFMGLSFRENIKVVLVFVLIYYISILLFIISLSIGFIKKRGIQLDIISLQLSLFAVCYFLLKQSIVRSDDHVLTFIPVIPALVLSGYTSIRGILNFNNSKRLDKPMLHAVIFSMVVFLFTVSSIYSSDATASYADRRFKQLLSVASNNPLNHYSFRSKQIQSAKDESAKGKYAEKLAEYIKLNYKNNEKIYFFGNTTSIIGDLSYEKPITLMPFIQNYAAFPPQIFDQRYVETLDREDSNLVIIEEIEASINDRVAYHELSKLYGYLFSNYRVVYSDTNARLYLFEKISSKAENCNTLGIFNARSNELITIPNKDEGYEHIKVQIKSSPSYLEKLVGVLLKPANLYLTLRTTDGVEVIKKTTTYTLINGVNIYPSYLSVTDFVKDSPMQLSGFSLGGGMFSNDTYSGEFMNCSHLGK